MEDLTKNFYTIEGGEGVGKTTVIQMLKEKLEKSGRRVVITREPGGDKVAELIRNIILDNEIHLNTEILLFAASRSEHLQNVIIPALRQGKIVISDRYVDSSLVYQGSVQKGENVWEINNIAINGFLPRKTFLLDLEPAIAMKRISDNNREQNRYDRKEIEFHNKVRDGYRELAANNPRIVVIDADKAPDEITNDIYREIE